MPVLDLPSLHIDNEAAATLPIVSAAALFDRGLGDKGFSLHTLGHVCAGSFSERRCRNGRAATRRAKRR